MTLALMLSGLFIGTVLALAAIVLHAQERAANRPVRWIWAAMIAATVLLTALMPSRAPFTEQGDVAESRFIAKAGAARVDPSAHGMVATLQRWIRNVTALPSAAVTASLQSATLVLSRVPAPVERAAAVAWVAGSVLCGLTLLLAYRRVRRSAEGWRCERLLGTDVRVSRDAGPAVIGLRPMEIVVPSWILFRTPQEQQLVLEHEREHIHAYDPVLLVSACAAVALMPWNPLLWYGLSRLRLAVEIDCDRRVLQGGTARHSYARLLLDLSAHPSQLGASLPALSYSASHLERRLLAMTTRPSRYALPRRAAGGAVAALLVLAACESRMPTSADVENMDARKATLSAAAIPGVDTARSTYSVDGVVVAKRDAERIGAGQIASIEVVRGKGRASQIRVRTLSGNGDTMTLSASRLRVTDSTFTGTGDVVAFLPSRRDSVSARMRSKSGFEGLFVIDGQIVSASVANALQPDRIASIEVVKGAAASRLHSDPRALNGIINITTRPR